MNPGSHQDSELRRRFERLYARWREELESPSHLLASADEPATENDAFKEIVALGEPAVPLVIERLEVDPDAHQLVHALPLMTGHDLDPVEVRAAARRQGRLAGNQLVAELWIERWRGQQEVEGQ